jgi:YD repeat-containing protein
MSAKEPRNFWHPPRWKWLVVLGLLILAVAADLAADWWNVRRANSVIPRPVDTTPRWDGVYPEVIVRVTTGASHKTELIDSISNHTISVQHKEPVNQFEVDLRSGMFVLRQTDFFIQDSVPLNLIRTFRPWDNVPRAFGIGANHPYDICPTGNRYPYTYMDLFLEDGNSVHFDRVSEGTKYADAVYKHYETSAEFYGSKISWNGNGWNLNFNDGSLYIFPEAYNAKNFAQGAATEMRDAKGNRTLLHRDASRNLEELVSPSGHKIGFDYDDASRVVYASDDAGHVRHYSYDSTGHLASVSDQAGILYRFTYEKDQLTVISDRDGNEIVHNRYQNGRIVEEKLLNKKIYRYEYLSHEPVGDTIVMLPDGKSKQFIFDNGKLYKVQ